MTSSTPTKLIIDTDPGIDDILSLIFAFSQPHVDLLAISLTFGNTTLDYARDNVLRLMEVCRKQWNFDQSHGEVASAVSQNWKRYFSEEATELIDLSLGATGPIGGLKTFNATYFHGRDGMSSVSFLEDDPFPLPRAKPAIAGDANGHASSKRPKLDSTEEAAIHVPRPLRLSSESSASLILKHLAENPPNTVRIAAIGPLTNLAIAWQQDPHTFARVESIHVMGGVLDIPGNTAPHSEFNTYADPVAAKVLFEEAVGHEALSGRPGARLPIYLLPLDVTHQHCVAFSKLIGRQDTPLGHFISSILLHPRKMTQSYAPIHLRPFDPLQDDLFVAHDPLAVAHACFAAPWQINDGQVGTSEGAADADAWKYTDRLFHIETEGKITRGMCVVDKRPSTLTPKSRYAAASGRSLAEVVSEHEAEAEATVQGTTPESAEVSLNPQSQSLSQSVPGLIKVVTSSPRGGKWFEDVFCTALGVALS